MRTTKQMTMGVLAVLAVVAMVAVMFILPNYREARDVQAQVKDLQARVTTLESRTHAVDRLAEEVRTARDHVAVDLKSIPETADVAGLIRKLSDPIDGMNVVDQTFTAGTAGPAIVGEDAPAMALPVIAEMHATFESAQALIRKAETMNRLVRVSSVRLQCKREEQKSDIPVLAASVGLEVIYAAPASTSKEGK